MAGLLTPLQKIEEKIDHSEELGKLYLDMFKTNYRVIHFINELFLNPIESKL